MKVFFLGAYPYIAFVILNMVQVELKRLQQKNAGITRELNRDVGDVDVDPLGQVSPERYITIN